MTELRNRSLERGIAILETIGRTGEATLADLHRESGIPKSTIRRLLGTLLSRRIVRRSLADQKYRLNITMTAGAGTPVPEGAGPLVDVAIPILSDHTRRVDWPSDIQIIDGGSMLVIDSTRPLSPFHLYRGVVNRAINIFGSATGQACLAAMPEWRIRDFIAQNRGNQRFGFERFSLTEEAIFLQVEKTRARGFGIRLQQYRGETIIDDGLGAIAVPVYKGGEVFGAISLLFSHGLFSPEEMAVEHLESLTAAASAITKDLDHYG